MYITDIQTLGTEYTVADQDGNIIRTIQVIPMADILSAAVGPYSEEIFGSFDNYIEKSHATLSGFDDLDPNAIMWYATEDEEVELAELIEFAMQNGYEKIILEHLDEIE